MFMVMLIGVVMDVVVVDMSVAITSVHHRVLFLNRQGLQIVAFEVLLMFEVIISMWVWVTSLRLMKGGVLVYLVALISSWGFLSVIVIVFINFGGFNNASSFLSKFTQKVYVTCKSFKCIWVPLTILIIVHYVNNWLSHTSTTTYTLLKLKQVQSIAKKAIKHIIRWTYEMKP